MKAAARDAAASVRAAALAVALSIAAGCAPSLTLSLGQMPTVDPQAAIHPGMTTRQEITGIYGPPDMTGTSDDGLPTFTYTRAVVEVVKARDAALTEYFNLRVTFKGDLVDSFSFDRKSK